MGLLSYDPNTETESGLLSLPGLYSRLASAKRRIGDTLAHPADALAQAWAPFSELGGQTNTIRAPFEHAGLLGSVMPEVRQMGSNLLAQDMRENENMALQLGLLGVTAYHGSPYTFDKFDASKIGTGEGAQAYGHGMYFAENPQVAKQYRDQLSWKTEGNFDLHPAQTNAEQAANNVLAHFNWNKEKAIKHVENLPPKYSGVNAERQLFEDEWNTKLLDALKRWSKEPIASVYKVDIPDDAVAKMLSADRALTREEGAAIRDAARALYQKSKDPNMNHVMSYGQTWSEYPPGFSNEIYPMIAARLGSDKAASDLLLAAGIPGIKYLDQGSRTAGAGTHNYVLFDPKLAKILSRE